MLASGGGDTSYINVWGNLAADFKILDVRDMLEYGSSEDMDVNKRPDVYQDFLEDNDYEYDEDELSDELYDNDSGSYLLDANGGRIESLADFDHLEGEDDEDERVWWRIPNSDLTDDGELTPEARRRWAEKLGVELDEDA